MLADSLQHAANTALRLSKNMASLKAVGLPSKELVVATLGENMATTLCLNFCLLTAKFYGLVVRFI
jgi:hypothetical protein